MTHWFISSLAEFTRKNAVLLEHCRVVGRDPSTIMRTIGAPLWLGRDDEDARKATAYLPSELQTMMPPAGPERAAEILRSCLEVGAQGFTFNSPNLSTVELLNAAGQVKRLLG